MLMYDPGIYTCEIMDYAFGTIKGDRPKITLYVLPKRLESDPQAPLPVPEANAFPKVDVILWGEDSDRVEEFVDDLYALGFRGDDIAQVCQGHAKYDTSLAGNEIRCRRKTKTYTSPTGKEYEQWGLVRAPKARSGGDGDVDEVAVAEKLRTVLQGVWSKKVGVKAPVSAGAEKSPF